MGVWLGWEGERLISCKQWCIYVFPNSWLYLCSYIWDQHLPFNLPFRAHHHYHHLGHRKSLYDHVDLLILSPGFLLTCSSHTCLFAGTFLPLGLCTCFPVVWTFLPWYPPASLFYSFKSLKCHFTEIFTLDKTAFPITVSLPYAA